jgi:hypothetical protein
MQVVDVAEVDVGSYDVTFGADPGCHPLRDGAVAAADFQASPSGTEAELFEEGLMQGIEEV